MIWTNKHGLPDSVVNAITHDTYDGGDGDFSATTLLKPPQMYRLQQLHKDEIEQDVVDNVWRLFGQAAHAILEGHAPDDAISEERLYINVNGHKIGGQVDMYHNGTITDYKITSAWSIVYDSRIIEWTEQLNIYAEIFRQNGYPVTNLQVVAILRDWDKNRALQGGDYPKTPIVVIPLTLWDDVRAMRFIIERVDLHSTAAIAPPARLCTLYACSPEDMWEQPSKYALKRHGAKRATKIYDTEEEAQSVCTESFFVEKRPGKRMRCEQYCQAAPWCQQYQQYKEEQSNE